MVGCRCNSCLIPMTERNMLFWGWFWLGVVFVYSGCICGQGATLWCRKPLLSPNNFTEGHLMEVEWLVIDVQSVGSPDIVDCAILRWFWLGVGLTNSVRSYDWGAILWCRNPLLSSNKFTQGNLMKIEWLVANITAVGSLGTLFLPLNQVDLIFGKSGQPFY